MYIILLFKINFRSLYHAVVGVWWNYCGDALPMLKKYAIRVLSQPCSSTSCERSRNAFEAAQTKNRSRLSPKLLDDSSWKNSILWK